MKRLILILLAAAGSSAAGYADCRPKPPANLVAYVPACPPGYVCAEWLRVLLQWRDVKSERGYVVERALPDPYTGLLGPWVTLATLPRDSESWADMEPAWGVVAAYRVRALNQCGYSEPSNVSYYLLR